MPFSDKKTQLQGVKELVQGHMPRPLAPCPVFLPLHLSAFSCMSDWPGQESPSPSDMTGMIKHGAVSGPWPHGRHMPESPEPVKLESGMDWKVFLGHPIVKFSFPSSWAPS